MRNTVLQAIESALKEKARLLIALDGPSASGKTTLAKALAEALSPKHTVTVVHMDDFFLPRTAHDYEKLGGNMDLVRVRTALTALSRGEDARYRPFLCGEQRLGEERLLKAADVILVEGSYALHSALFDLYELRFCLTVEEDEQRARILKREGERAEAFFQKWIPLEKKHLASLDEAARARITFL